MRIPSEGRDKEAHICKEAIRNHGNTRYNLVTDDPATWVTEVGRKFQKVIKGWLLDDAGLESVFGVRKVFIKRDSGGGELMLVENIADYILFG